MGSEKIFFNSQSGFRLCGRMFSGEKKTGKGLIFSHGLFSTKDGYKITRMADTIVEAGYDLLTYDFSYAGESGGTLADISILKSLEDLESAVDFFRGLGYKEIHLMGSSMGGAVSTLYAGKHPRVPASLISIATPLDLKALYADNMQIKDVSSLPDDGFSVLDGIAIKNSFFKEISGVDMTEVIHSIRCPVLIIHGKKDAIVSFGNTGLFIDNLHAPYKTLFIENGDHNLTQDAELELIKKEISEWLNAF
ncbi:MAG TPA: alpha/beta hydrolase [Spirochaetota bacterium]|nr:alpha/beta hydrolase [Spirochaetota bacterium]HPI87724.1 alpha/beta hydrolase [Spirochaetota bacterium]HPR48151.1 alpha/beta hydrolase [Spirochaetota bacterium]